MQKIGFLFLEDNIVCPICLEVFKDPVTTACGHNFCMNCLHVYWEHLALIGEQPYCPQCREPFSSTPQLRKNITLGEIAMRFAQEETQDPQKLASFKNVPCDFCFTRKLKAVKSCLQCIASLCDNHIQSHYTDKIFKNHQLVEPLSDLKGSMCVKHRKLLELFCKEEGKFICQICVQEKHKNHEVISLKQERNKKEERMENSSWVLRKFFATTLNSQIKAEIQRIHASMENQVLILIEDHQKHRARVNYLMKVVKNTRDEVSWAFTEVLKEFKRLQTKVMDFIDQEEKAALLDMGNSIQRRHEQLADLKKKKLWLTNLMDDPSDFQFLQDFPKIKAISDCSEALIGLKCEELSSFVGIKQTLSDLKSQLSMIGLCFINKILQKGITMVPYELLPTVTDRKTLLKYYCILNFDATTANEELFLFKETHSVLNMGILLETYSKPTPGFNHWPQLLGTRSLCEGCHYWEAEISNGWLCLGVAYSYRHRIEKSCMLYLIGRNNYSWCLEWDSVNFSVWHNNIQTMLRGDYYKTIGVFLDYAAGSLTFYGITSSINLIYRFLTTFTEPLYPAAMISSGTSITLKQHPE
ncbi:E3 ubiquitin/ISG15 ligase TRIM25-like isoform X1 [Ahaetulla prasina]|uniref:E3 ubiquitin/ISG15 ligase TRIM25-like isoform X1 n=1 Tax=Ahaetulla prasina TaxID=499056 RepID=UPI002648C4DA|nr:E3 ubiquitin/ISG15 ligase TRIM25-like isoform X1 [Ahaetulla prasina]